MDSSTNSTSKVQRRAPEALSLLDKLLIAFRNVLIKSRTLYLRRFWGMDVHPDTQISLKAHLDKTNAKGIHIGQGTLVAFGSVVLAHDMSRALTTDTFIGRNCFIGARSIILPGIRVGDGSIVATGSVVTRNVPPGSVVAGNPARVIKSGIATMKWGVLEESFREALKIQLEADAIKASAKDPD
jgi:acetyltransferase-like isoleucine patch superfamily enzyme